MKEKKNTQYTIREVPEATDHLLRESALAEGISLNQASIRALERGLGLDGGRVVYRRLRHLAGHLGRQERAAWQKALSEQDVVDPEAWK